MTVFTMLRESISKPSFHLLRNSKGWPGRHFEYLRDRSEFCDVTLLTEDGTSFPAHKVILSSQSDKLRAILSQFPASSFCLYLTGIASRDLTALLAFIYSGEVKLSQGQLLSFLSAANILQVGGLVEDHQQLSGEKTEEEQENLTVEEVSGEITEEEQERVIVEEVIEEEEAIEIKEETDISETSRSKSQVKIMENCLPLKRKETEISTEDLMFEETSDDFEEEKEIKLWDDVNTVSFEFIKMGKSRLEGVLITHDRNYRYQKNRTSKDGKVHYYTCSEKKSGCKATAVIERIKRFDEREGEFLIENRLVSVNKPEVHAKIHQSDNSAIEFQRLLSLMKQEISRDPSVPIGKN